MIKCSICGSLIQDIEGQRIIVCPYCGTKQSIKNNVESKKVHIKDDL